MQYVSELIGARVRDPGGRVIARVSDVLVPVDADYPALEALSLKPSKGEQRTVPWSAVRILDGGGLGLSTGLAEAAAFDPPPHLLSLARQVMDHQIIDADQAVVAIRRDELQVVDPHHTQTVTVDELVIYDLAGQGQQMRRWI